MNTRIARASTLFLFAVVNPLTAQTKPQDSTKSPEPPDGGGTWVKHEAVGAPVEREYFTALWTGSEMLIWGGSTGRAPLLNDGARYDPTTKHWTPMNNIGAP
ncbi:MAG: hypothetical protein Q8M07_00920, partial [Prosthecobacter sp.]|nr:hypothetical protein [Prosthecobacter sp.]